MSEQTIFTSIVIGWFALAVVFFPVLFFITAPYGRHKQKGQAAVPDSWGWVIMELPAVLVFGWTFFDGTYRQTITAIIFFLMWMAHYVQRTFIYPFLQRKSQKGMPWQIVTMGFFFNVINGYLNGRYLFEFSGGYSSKWIKDWRFLLGLLLFLAGYTINRDADRILRQLRDRRNREYQIPRGGFYRWVTCPNYLGEVIIWIGWAVATWSFVGLTFAMWTTANLVPRAWAHHKWYQEQFANYPPERRALLPGVW